MQEMQQELWVQSPSQEDPLEKKMATHSSILAWEIMLVSVMVNSVFILLGPSSMRPHLSSPTS